MKELTVNEVQAVSGGYDYGTLFGGAIGSHWGSKIGNRIGFAAGGPIGSVIGGLAGAGIQYVVTNYDWEAHGERYKERISREIESGDYPFD
jgi:hypothetical protein